MSAPSNESPHVNTSVNANKGHLEHLAAVERWVLLLSVVLVGASLLFGSLRFQYGALVGAGLSMMNARSMSFLLARLQPKRSMGLLIALFQLKLGFIAALIYLALKFLPLQPLGLLLGLSVLPLAIVARGIQFGLRPHDPSEGETPADDDTLTSRDTYRDTLTEN